MLFVHDAQGALLAAAPMGLMGGVATAAYIDLLIRSCPPGLQGTTLMLSSGLYYVASRFGDVLGTGVYQAFGGFAVCVALITAVYAMILPLILARPQKDDLLRRRPCPARMTRLSAPQLDADHVRRARPPSQAFHLARKKIKQPA